MSLQNPGSQFFIKEEGYLIRCSPLDVAVERVIILYFQPKILYLSHYVIFAGQLGSRRMYVNLTNGLYWQKMANDVYKKKREWNHGREIVGRTTKIRST